MSKKGLIKATKHNRVIALPSKTIKDKNGNVVKTLYNIFKMG